MQEACFFYDPDLEGRWALGISIRGQLQLAWKWGHCRFMVMDGTFNTSKSPLLLFGIVVVDERNKGIPVALLLLTPKNRVKGHSSDYDSHVLQRLLEAFRDAVTKEFRRTHPGSTLIFTPRVSKSFHSIMVYIAVHIMKLMFTFRWQSRIWICGSVTLLGQFGSTSSCASACIIPQPTGTTS